MSDYTPTDKPINGAWLTSKVIRDEFALIETAVNSKADSYGTSSVSTTSMVISDILQTFTMETGKELIPGMFVYIGDAAAPSTNYMLGMLISYNSTTGLSEALVTSHVGSGTKTSWVIGLSNSNGATLVNNAFTGHQDFARATVASHATTADIWSALGNQIDFTGTATVTAFPAALQAGAHRELVCAGACTFTAGANMLIDGVDSGSSITCAANDVMIVRAITTTQFKLTRQRYDGKAQKDVGDHIVTVHTGNGHGSSSTKIRRFTTAMVNTGTAITYADSSTLGASFTINEAGLYEIFYADSRIAGACRYGASLNTASPTLSIASLAVAERILPNCTVGGANLMSIPVTRTVKLAVNDIIRPHTDGTVDATGDENIFSIRKVSHG